jgi:hypothetical protein
MFLNKNLSISLVSGVKSIDELKPGDTIKLLSGKTGVTDISLQKRKDTEIVLRIPQGYIEMATEDIYITPGCLVYIPGYGGVDARFLGLEESSVSDETFVHLTVRHRGDPIIYINGMTFILYIPIVHNRVCKRVDYIEDKSSWAAERCYSEDTRNTLIVKLSQETSLSVSQLQSYQDQLLRYTLFNNNSIDNIVNEFNRRGIRQTNGESLGEEGESSIIRQYCDEIYSSRS